MSLPTVARRKSAGVYRRGIDREDQPTMDEAATRYAVPVRNLPGRQVRTGRSPQGQRVGIAFTRVDLLVAAMGADQPWEELCESALRAMLRPLGIDRIQVDPLLVAPPLAESVGDLAAPTAPVRMPALAGTGGGPGQGR
ncbi:SAV_915 family protein [Micromonospora profundi]|uniref:SAV_915 family protein n=1 Tax=Micromonospora profundi TaxID=1420889 RepID=UPI0033A097EE